jgi:tetratricopeptide (TPR) repeat protein
MTPSARLLVVLLCLAVSACAGSAPLPPKAVALNNDAAQNVARGDLDRAAAELRVALEYNPRFIEATYNLGLIEFERGNYVAARDQFLRAQTLNRDLPWGSFGLGLVADATNRLADAALHYRDALSVDPGFSVARINWASVLTKRGNLEGAFVELKKCAETAPQQAEIWIMLVSTASQLGRFGELDDLVSRAALHLGEPEASVVKALRLLATDRIGTGGSEEAQRTLAQVRASVPASWRSTIDRVVDDTGSLDAQRRISDGFRAPGVYIRP